MKAQILKVNEVDEYYFDEGCYILELSNSATDPELSIARARVKPGVTTQMHCLTGVIERYVILSGLGAVELVEQDPEPVTAGDVVIIPPSCPQRISNVGTEDLVFLAICSPRFTTSIYESV